MLAFVALKDQFLLSFVGIAEGHDLASLHQFAVQVNVQVHLLEVLLSRNGADHPVVIVVGQGGARAQTVRLCILRLPGLLSTREPLVKIVTPRRSSLLFGPV